MIPSNTDLGVSQKDGQWNWKCGCGVLGQPTTDRDICRDNFKKHRQACVPSGSTPPQQSTKPQGGESTMATKKTSGKKSAPKGDSKARERAVSEKEAFSVIEKLKSGKSSVMAEARRLGCYHATLRKALRAAVGEAAYTKLMNGKKGATPAAKKPAAKKKVAAKKKPTAPRKRAAKPVAPAATEPAATETAAPATTEGATE